MFVVKILVVWLIMVLAAILNGLFRDKILTKQFDEKSALSLSGLTLSFLILFIVYASMPLFNNTPYSYMLYIGIIWVLMTLAFEFLFSKYALKKSFKETLEIFDIKSGNLFIVVLIITALSPYLIAILLF